MMSQTDEGAGVVKKRFGSMFANGHGYGRDVDLEQREANERRATKTEGQKARSQGKSKLMNIKVTETWQTRLRNFAASETIAQDRKVTMTEIIEQAVSAYMEQRGFKG